VRRVRPDQWTESFDTDDRDRVTAAIQFACQQRRLPLERWYTRRSVVMTTAVCPCGGWCPRSCARCVSTAATDPKTLPPQEAHPCGALGLVFQQHCDVGTEQVVIARAFSGRESPGQSEI
jgi:hypothetical protein